MTVFNGSSRPSIRAILIAFGWFSLILGMIGAMVPVMPSMVFLLASLWCFSKGSRRFYTWLYGHRVFGRRYACRASIASSRYGPSSRR